MIGAFLEPEILGVPVILRRNGQSGGPHPPKSPKECGKFLEDIFREFRAVTLLGQTWSR